MTHDFSTIEQLAKRLCQESGGDWDKPRTKKNHWRRKAGDLYANQKPVTRESIIHRIKQHFDIVFFGGAK